ncbi:MAG: hypothetical protein ACYC33_00155 [Thermoleophilia bacterium]
MSNKLLVKGAALIAVGALGLIGLGALGPVFGPGTASAERQAPSWMQSVRPTPVSDESTPPRAGTSGDLESRITEMMRDHMGISGEEAAQWAGTMEDMMRSVHGDQVDDMLEYCDENGGPGGMMGGNYGGPGGMMGGSYGGGMMGGSGGPGGMMGGWGN